MDPAQIHDSLKLKGHEKAKAAAYFSTMDRYRKQTKAYWTVHYINEGEGVGKSEQMALLEEEYQDACKRCEKAEEDSGIAHTEYAAALAYIDIWRSLQAMERAKIGIL